MLSQVGPCTLKTGAAVCMQQPGAPQDLSLGPGSGPVSPPGGIRQVIKHLLPGEAVYIEQDTTQSPQSIVSSIKWEQGLSKGTHGGKWPPRPCDAWDWVTAAVSADKAVVQTPSSLGRPSAIDCCSGCGVGRGSAGPPGAAPTSLEGGAHVCVSHPSRGLWAGWPPSWVEQPLPLCSAGASSPVTPFYRHRAMSASRLRPVAAASRARADTGSHSSQTPV